MARRRVFKTRAKCPGVNEDLRPTSNQHRMVGRPITLEKAATSEINLILDGSVVGQLDPVVGSQVALALERGQSFTAVIEKAFPMYNDEFKQTGAHLDIKVEYLLERGQPAIETPKGWRSVESPNPSNESRSFFTTVAGVTFEGRQRIVARCSEGESLILCRDPNNKFDEGAIKVLRSNGEQVGFIPAHVSRACDPSGLAVRMDRGDQYDCRITNITGGGRGESLGVNIEITERGEFAEALQLQESVHRPPGDSPSLQPELLWILAVIILGLIVWALLK